MQLVALISVAAGPLVILGSISRRPAFGLVHNLCIYDWDWAVDGLLIGPQLAAVVTTAVVIANYSRSHSADAGDPIAS